MTRPYAREMRLRPKSFPLDSHFDPCEGRDHTRFFYTQRSRRGGDDVYGAWHCQVCGERLGDWWILHT